MEVITIIWRKCERKCAFSEKANPIKYYHTQIFNGKRWFAYQSSNSRVHDERSEKTKVSKKRLQLIDKVSFRAPPDLFLPLRLFTCLTHSCTRLTYFSLLLPKQNWLNLSINFFWLSFRFWKGSSRQKLTTRIRDFFFWCALYLREAYFSLLKLCFFHDCVL